MNLFYVIERWVILSETRGYRSQMMSKIHSTGGKAESILAKALWHEGIRYFRNYTKIIGKPDIAITKYKIAIFVDGEFWHGYDWENQKKIRLHHNREYWIEKIEKNIERDKYVVEQLEKQGWLVIRFWEKQEVLSNLPQCISKVKKAIEERADRSKN